MEIISGKIVAWERGYITIRAPYDNVERFIRREYEEVEIGLKDGRTITPQQRRKAFALIGEIAEYVGDNTEDVKEERKHDFLREHAEGLEKEMFSLSNCSVTRAREFIEYLIKFILRHDIPTHVPLAELADDVDQYVYSCLIYKKCAACGAKAELHHVDTVGMGNNRNKVEHLGRRCLPLCRKHHEEAHQMGDEAFAKYHHLNFGIIDERIIKVYHLKGGSKSA